MTTIDRDNYFDAATGLYFYCVDWHGGQASKEYEILSRLQTELNFKPGMSEPDDQAQDFYSELEQSKNVQAFYQNLKDVIDTLDKE